MLWQSYIRINSVTPSRIQIKRILGPSRLRCYLRTNLRSILRSALRGMMLVIVFWNSTWNKTVILKISQNSNGLNMYCGCTYGFHPASPPLRFKLDRTTASFAYCTTIWMVPNNSRTLNDFHYNNLWLWLKKIAQNIGIQFLFWKYKLLAL